MDLQTGAVKWAVSDEEGQWQSNIHAGSGRRCFDGPESPADDAIGLKDPEAGPAPRHAYTAATSVPVHERGVG
jgi:hypothetical protein